MTEIRKTSPEEMQKIMLRVRRERAAVYADGARKVAGFVARLVRNVAGAFAEARRQQALYEELSRMNDRELRDLGLNRSDIPAVVAGVYADGEAAARRSSGPDRAPVPPRTPEDRLAA